MSVPLIPNELKDIENLIAPFKKKKKKKKKSKIGHQRNILVGFVKFILAISVLFKIRGRWRIIPVQKTLKYNCVSNITGQWLLTSQFLTSNLCVLFVVPYFILNFLFLEF